MSGSERYWRDVYRAIAREGEVSVDREPTTRKEDEAAAIVCAVLFAWGTVFLLALALLHPWAAS